MKGKGNSPVHGVARECIAVRLRTINRALTRVYDDALRPHGLRVGQLNLLIAIGRAGEAPSGELCRTLQLEKSTLSRDLEVLRRKGWIEPAPGSSARAQRHRLTPGGEALVERAMPAWRDAQARARELLGEDLVSALSTAAARLWRETSTRA